MAFFDYLLATTETLTVSLWTGAAAGYAFLAAPTVAREADDRERQARITGTVLARIVDVANVCEGAAIFCALVRSRETTQRRTALARAALGTGAVAALRVFRTDVLPAMTRLQREMGTAFKDAADDDPLRIEYRAQHHRSTQVFGAALLGGLGQLVLLAATAPRGRDR